MSEQFQPGDLVECVDDTGCPELSVGALYTVTECYVIFNGPGINVAEAFPGVGWRGYFARRFRKVYRPDPKFIERLTAEPVIMPPVRQPGKVDA